MYKENRIASWRIELYSHEIFSIKTESRTILDLEMAKALIGTCNQMISREAKNYGYVIDITDVAFITEDARNFITEQPSQGHKVKALALVSSNHLGNIISTLLISVSYTHLTLPTIYSV